MQESPWAVGVVMTEYRFQTVAGIGPGRAVFEVRNGGQLDHELSLARLPDDLPPIAEQLKGSVRRPVPTVAYLPRQGPGARGTFAVDLVPGRYALICNLPDADGVQHSSKGMAVELKVR